MKTNRNEEKGSYVGGIDIGSATTKAVILQSKKIVSSLVMPTGHRIVETGERVIGEALMKVGLGLCDLGCIVATGYGRKAARFAGKRFSEITCHAIGARYLSNRVRTVVDIGGQDSKVIGLDEKGSIHGFAMNDKCAAGTGRFLENIARVLDSEVNEIGDFSLKGESPCLISSTCAVFAESEVVTLRAEGKTRENIFAGIHKAMAHRIVIMGGSVGFRKAIAFTGGVAKNRGMKLALENELGVDLWVPKEHQIVGALGAAVVASNELGS
jgi:(R)-2-hydroxyacyl-CoA dehydratese activating ATPase